MAIVPVRDARLSVTEQGQGRPLLLVHGFPLDHSMWEAQIDELSDSFRVIAPDLRGFGQSTVTEETVTMEDYSDDCAALLDALGIAEPVVFCGLSMGGYIAWQFAQRHRTRLAKLILCDTRAAADAPAAAEGRMKTAEKVLKEGAGVIAESMLGKLFAPKTLQERPQVVEATREVILRTTPQGIAAALRGMAERPDVTPRLATLDDPVLLICGTEDAITPLAEMRGVADKLPHAKLVEVADAGHMAPLEQPQVVNAAIREFLR